LSLPRTNCGVVVDGPRVIAIVAERSPGAGDRHDRGVAIAVVRSAASRRAKQSSAAVLTGRC